MARTIDTGPRGGQPIPTSRQTGLESEVYEALVEATEAASYEVGRALAAFDLSLPQFQVLTILSRVGPGGLLVHEAARRMPARAPNITRLVDRLESKGLVQRARSSTDRRAVHLHITERGRECLDRVAAPMEAAVVRSLNGVDGGDLLLLRTLLRRLIGFPADGSQTNARRNGRDTH